MSKRAFTLFEVLVVAAFVVVLFLIVLPWIYKPRPQSVPTVPWVFKPDAWMTWNRGGTWLRERVEIVYFDGPNLHPMLVRFRRSDGSTVQTPEYTVEWNVPQGATP